MNKNFSISNWKDVNISNDVTLYANYKAYPVLIDFLSRCIEYDPEQRWSAQQLINHPLLSRETDLLSMKPITIDTSASSATNASTNMDTNATDIISNPNSMVSNLNSHLATTSTPMDTLTVLNEDLHLNIDCAGTVVKNGSLARGSVDLLKESNLDVEVTNEKISKTKGKKGKRKGKKKSEKKRENKQQNIDHTDASRNDDNNGAHTDCNFDIEDGIKDAPVSPARLRSQLMQT